VEGGRLLAAVPWERWQRLVVEVQVRCDTLLWPNLGKSATWLLVGCSEGVAVAWVAVAWVAVGVADHQAGRLAGSSITAPEG
jgi:hypothetical protein